MLPTVRHAGDSIRELREKKGWSTEDVADRLGISGSGDLIAEWEDGTRRLSGPLAAFILRVLKLELGEARSAPLPIQSLKQRANATWHRADTWRPNWRQVSATALERKAIPANLYTKLFPGTEIPPTQYAHGFPFLDHGLPRSVFNIIEGVWRGTIPIDPDSPPAYIWRLERDGSFLYREKIWEDDKTSVTSGSIHVGSLLEIVSATVFFLRRLIRQVDIGASFKLELVMHGMEDRGIVAAREGMPSDLFAVDEPKTLAKEVVTSSHIHATASTIVDYPLSTVYDLVSESILTLRPDLANRSTLEKQLRLRHSSDDRRGDVRFLGFLDEVLGRPLRRAVVSVSGRRVGILAETTYGTKFTYDAAYRTRSEAQALSPNMPLRRESFESSGLLPFFENLLPEGDQLSLLLRQRSLNKEDKFGILLATLPSSMGSVQLHKEE